MFDPLHEWLGIAPSEQPPNHYRLLGLSEFESNSAVINQAADRILATLHEFGATEYGAEAEKLSNQVSAARLLLLNSERKRDYDKQLRSTNSNTSPTVGVTSQRTTEEFDGPALAAIAPQARVAVVRTHAKPRHRPTFRQRTAGILVAPLLVLLVLVWFLGPGEEPVSRSGIDSYDNSSNASRLGLQPTGRSIHQGSTAPTHRQTSKPKSEQRPESKLEPSTTPRTTSVAEDANDQPNAKVSVDGVSVLGDGLGEAASVSPSSSLQPGMRGKEAIESSEAESLESLAIKETLASLRGRFEARISNANTLSEHRDFATLLLHLASLEADGSLMQRAIHELAAEELVKAFELQSAYRVIKGLPGDVEEEDKVVLLTKLLELVPGNEGRTTRQVHQLNIFSMRLASDWLYLGRCSLAKAIYVQGRKLQMFSSPAYSGLTERFDKILEAQEISNARFDLSEKVDRGNSSRLDVSILKTERFDVTILRAISWWIYADQRDYAFRMILEASLRLPNNIGKQSRWQTKCGYIRLAFADFEARKEGLSSTERRVLELARRKWLDEDDYLSFRSICDKPPDESLKAWFTVWLSIRTKDRISPYEEEYISQDMLQAKCLRDAIDAFESFLRAAGGKSGAKIDSRLLLLHEAAAKYRERFQIPDELLELAAKNPDQGVQVREKIPKILDGFELPEPLATQTYIARKWAPDFAKLEGNQIQIGMRGVAMAGSLGAVGMRFRNVSDIRVSGKLEGLSPSEPLPGYVVGIFLDYKRRGAKATDHRVHMHIAGNRRFAPTKVLPWGSASRISDSVSLGMEPKYEIDLKKHAPPLWTGEVWFTLFAGNTGPECTLKADIDCRPMIEPED